MTDKDKNELTQLRHKMNRVVSNLASFTKFWSPYTDRMDFEIIKVKTKLKK